jgi:transcriptional regulator with XRE-family HTH domain
MKKRQYLPAKVKSELERIGSGIRTARSRRRMTQAELAERVGTTFHTISKMERGAPGTGIGLYMKALWVLGLLGGVAGVADPSLDEEGLILQAARAPKRVRAGQVSNDF